MFSDVFLFPQNPLLWVLALICLATVVLEGLFRHWGWTIAYFVSFVATILVGLYAQMSLEQLLMVLLVLLLARLVLTLVKGGKHHDI